MISNPLRAQVYEGFGNMAWSGSLGIAVPSNEKRLERFRIQPM
jgi:hypothetical protein